MAYAGKMISNPVTGQEIRFIKTGKDTNGQLLEMKTIYTSKSVEPPLHYHPKQAEDFKVLKGSLSVRINGEVKMLKEGDHLHIPPNTVHAMWNPSESTCVVNWQVRPALQTEFLLETGMGLANDGKINLQGMPSFLQTITMGSRFGNEYRLAKPAYLLQKAVFLLLKPAAYLLGYQPVYKQYVD
jgi:quercetin dioxygenase-like cupin family protein